jgi:hypothetical protein
MPDDNKLEDDREEEDLWYKQELAEKKERDFWDAADYYYERDGDR